MRRATGALLVAMAAVAALVLPAGAGAAKTYHQRAYVEAELHLRGSHGFRFFVATFSKTEIVTASKSASRFGIESVDYVAKGKHPAFHDGAIQVKVGKLGTFHGRFVARSTETRKPADGCTGDPTITEKGSFVGSFNFRGERGYSTIHAHSADGSVTRQGASSCPAPTEHPGREAKRIAREEKDNGEHEVSLLAGEEDFHVFFEAGREEPPQLQGPPTTSFQASSNGGKAGAFHVSHAAFLFDFAADSAPTFRTPNLAEPTAEATVEPPAPFSGSAAFQLETPQTASWTGNLAVELPGLGKLPLTGGAIQAGLCAPRTHCTQTLPDHLQQVLEAPPGVITTFTTRKGGSS